MTERKRNYKRLESESEYCPPVSRKAVYRMIRALNPLLEASEQEKMRAYGRLCIFVDMLIGDGTSPPAPSP